MISFITNILIGVLGEKLFNKLCDAWKNMLSEPRAIKKALSVAVKVHGYSRHEKAVLKEFMQAWLLTPTFRSILRKVKNGEHESVHDVAATSLIENTHKKYGQSSISNELAIRLINTFVQELVENLLTGPDSNILDSRIQSKRHKDYLELAKSNNDAMGMSIGSISDKLDELISSNDLPKQLNQLLSKQLIIDLQNLMAGAQPYEAIQLVDSRISAIRMELQELNEPELLFNSLKPLQQHLLFTGASAASWTGELMLGQEYCRRALSLGPVDAELYVNATEALFNVQLVNELRHLHEAMDKSSEEYSRAGLLLSFLEGRWNDIDQELYDTKNPHFKLMRADARIRIIDYQEIESVKSTADLLLSVGDELELAMFHIYRANLTLDLLEGVINHYTPLTFDRKPLVASVTPQVMSALSSTTPNTLLRAKAINLLIRAKHLLADDKLNSLIQAEIEAIDSEILNRIIINLDDELSLDKIDDLVAEKHISDLDAMLYRAKVHMSRHDSLQAENILREALFRINDLRMRGQILKKLVHILFESNRINELNSIINLVPLHPADKWLIEMMFLNDDKDVTDFLDNIDSFSLDFRVVHKIASTFLKQLENGASINHKSTDLAERALFWSKRLLEILPSRSVLLFYSEALLITKHFEDLLVVSKSLDPVYGERASELEAWALFGLSRQHEAADRLVSANSEFPNSIRIAINASGLLLEAQRPAEALKLLEKFVHMEDVEPDIYFNYANAILNSNPGSPESASQAFDLFVKAYDIRPDESIAMAAWRASIGAGREIEAKRFFELVTINAPRRIVNTAQELEEATINMKQPIVLFENSLNAFKEAIEWEQNRNEALDQLVRHHILSYADLFRYSGRAWEHWSIWTNKFELNRNSSNVSFSVLASWTSSQFEYRRRSDHSDKSILLDLSAVLSLGILGSKTAKHIVQSLGTIFIDENILVLINEEKISIQNDMMVYAADKSRELIDYIKSKQSTIITYTSEIDAVSPHVESLGATRIDIGAAILHNGWYISDHVDPTQLPDDINHICLTSSLLALLLNKKGIITNSDVDSIREQHSGFFNVELDPLRNTFDLPDVLVFDEYSLEFWMKSGLLENVTTKIMVGPWVWQRLNDQADRNEIRSIAYARLTDISTFLHTAIQNGDIRKVKMVEVALTETQSNKDKYSLNGLWENSLKVLLTAKEYGYHIWADDRFYSLFLWFGGFPVDGPEIESIRAPFRDWAKSTPPLSTYDILSRLSESGVIDKSVALDAADKLFKKGYRPSHSILLHHRLAQFPFPEDDTITPPYQELVDDVKRFRSYLSPEIEQNKRHGMIRVAALETIEWFIAGIWYSDTLNFPQKRLFADHFLLALESIFSESYLEDS